MTRCATKQDLIRTTLTSAFITQRERVAYHKKIKSARKDVPRAGQRTRKALLCGTFAALRLCVKIFAFFALI
jgi:hypothetical protein